MSTSSQQATGQRSSGAFEQQRAALLNDVASSLENVLQKINRLNRNLEGIIAVGSEFGQVESLWSQFEGVMAKDARDQSEPVTNPDGANADT